MQLTEGPARQPHRTSQPVEWSLIGNQCTASQSPAIGLVTRAQAPSAMPRIANEINAMRQITAASTKKRRVAVRCCRTVQIPNTAAEYGIYSGWASQRACEVDSAMIRELEASLPPYKVTTSELPDATSWIGVRHGPRLAPSGATTKSDQTQYHRPHHRQCRSSRSVPRISSEGKIEYAPRLLVVNTEPEL